MKAKLLYVVNHPEFFLSHRLPFALAARQAGYEVHVATSKTAGVGEIERQGFTWHEIPLQPGGKNPLSDARLMIELIRLYRRLRPDLVHHVTIKPVLYGGLAVRLAGVPAVVHALTGLGYLFGSRSAAGRLFSGFLTQLLKIAFGHPNVRLILQNPDDRQAFVDNGIIAEAGIELIKGSGVDMDRFAPVPEMEGRKKVVLASRLLWEKGVGEFVEAAGMLAKNGTDARFVLAGEPDANNPLAIPQATLKAWHRTGAIEWIGFCEDMAGLFSDSHIVVLPSYYGEGVPKVLIEAAAAGRAIVTTDMPGCREIVRDGENGLLVPPRDSRKLAGAIATLLHDQPLRERMGRNGREIARGEFSLEKVVGLTLGVYGRLLERAGR